ncbi:DUF1624 domain-containing protein [Sphingomonas sp. R647]|uniref:DUF1624 domain-containing protein n=1 Tax=Sphingomonas sp. R647 TaxID=2875233 RepID=UPI001CD7CF9A|nr:DUF1624 domain-containing protein [Sphingomonas sp. R647]MCA1199913.1 DUF1624 domain-containing protein [Sphingomonas sp. R647]
MTTATSGTQLHPSRARIVAIDALRGLVILLMLVDHAREFFYYHAQVSDPMNLATTEPALFFTRLTAHLCAPIFVALTGLSAYLYGEAKGGKAAASSFLLKRGLFLILLEVTVVGFAWNFDFTPARIYLQVIWVIGLSMIALAALLHLSHRWLILLGAAIVLGHNLLDPITAAPGDWYFIPWAILHDRTLIDLPWGGDLRTSYPLLPWIGIIMLGYGIGPWFRAEVPAPTRQARLVGIGVAMLAAFAVLRTINLYGDPSPWVIGEVPLRTIMSFLNLTKYPPSADFALLTLGTGALVMAAFDRMSSRLLGWLTVFGSVPLFFYILHLYGLHLLNIALGMVIQHREGVLVSVPNVGAIWLVALAAAVPCWFACRWFGAIKRRSGRWWMRYL